MLARAKAEVREGCRRRRRFGFGGGNSLIACLTGEGRRPGPIAYAATTALRHHRGLWLLLQ